MDDGGRLQGFVRQVTTTLTDGAEILPQDPRRVYVCFQQLAGGSGAKQVTASGAIQGRISFRWGPLLPLLELYYSRHGPLPGCRWFAEQDGVGYTVQAYELLYLG